MRPEQQKGNSLPCLLPQETGAPEHVKSLDDCRWLLIGSSVLQPWITGSDAGQASSAESLLFGCCLAGQMSCSVCLNFDHRQPYHCCFYKGLAGALSSCPEHKAVKISGCHTVPRARWPLWAGARFPLVAEALCDHSSLPPNQSFYPLWGTSLLFRRWSVPLALLCWPPSNFWLKVKIPWDSLPCAPSAWRSSVSLFQLLKTAAVEIHSCIKHRTVIQTEKEAGVKWGIIMKMVWFGELVMN